MTDPERAQSSSAQNKMPLRERPIHEVATMLKDILGPKLVAYGINESDPARINLFATSEDTPQEDTEKTLRDMAEVTEVLTERDSADVARAIMIGMSPNLDDQAPIEVMRNGESDRVVANAQFLLGD